MPSKPAISESALTSLEELHVQNRDYPQLQTLLGEVVDKLIVRSQSRRQLSRSASLPGPLAKIEPQHEIVEKWTRALGDEAKS